MKPGENGSYSIPDFIVACTTLVGFGLGIVVASPFYGTSKLISWCKKGTT